MQWNIKYLMGYWCRRWHLVHNLQGNIKPNPLKLHGYDQSIGWRCAAKNLRLTLNTISHTELDILQVIERINVDILILMREPSGDG